MVVSLQCKQQHGDAKKKCLDYQELYWQQGVKKTFTISVVTELKVSFYFLIWTVPQYG